MAANTKFGEVGLEVSVRDKLGPKVVVQIVCMIGFPFRILRMDVLVLRRFFESVLMLSDRQDGQTVAKDA